MATFVLDPTIHTIASVPRQNRQFQRKQYRDKQFKGGESEWKRKLEKSTTVYVGNLSCYTNEYQLYELFTRCGSIKRIIMGLDKIKKTPCGFCFVEFDDRESALKSINFLSRTHLDGRDIQVDIDAGFEEGRQYGRGTHGGQVGDERRREQGSGGGGAGGFQGSQRGGYHGGSTILTRSITIVACLAVISTLMISTGPSPVTSDIIIRPFNPTNRAHLMNTKYIRQNQIGQQRQQFEKNFAQLLVGLMKTAKPSLLQAFIQATLADPQLKELAIKAFFNNTDSDD